MKTNVRSLAAALFVALAIGGCSSETANPFTPRTALSGPFPVTLPAPGDRQVDEEEFEICKVGSASSFNYTITDRTVTPNTVTNHQVNLADGECKVITYAGGKGQLVSVTENVPAGFLLSHVEVQVRTGSPYPGSIITTHTESGPTVTDSIAANVTGFTVLRGVLATFYNDPIPAGAIGDFVWNDLNGDGVQDPGEPGLAGVTVSLSGSASATTTTDASGAYLFSGLSSGNYTVTATLPAGFTASPANQGGDPLKDSNGSPAAVSLATLNTSDLSIDFGYVPIPPPPTGQIGDFVWKDANGNGIQDAGEAGFGGLTVTLTGPVNATTTTNASGNYLFSNLPAGSYTVTVGTPSGYSASPSNQGGDPLKDSNGSPAGVTLATNSSADLSLDFGFALLPLPPPGTTTMTVCKQGTSASFSLGGRSSRGGRDDDDHEDDDRDGRGGRDDDRRGGYNSSQPSRNGGSDHHDDDDHDGNGGHGGGGSDFSLNAGGCRVIATHTVGTSNTSLTITEDPPRNTVLDSIVKTGATGRQKVTGTKSITVVTSDLGNVTVTFYNRRIAPPPPHHSGGYGCRPDYWSRTQSYTYYNGGYSPSMQFSAAFNSNAFPGKTLAQVLALQGNSGLNALGRHAVAALLNAASPDVEYYLQPSQVIRMFNQALSGRNYDDARRVFERYNTDDDDGN